MSKKTVPRTADRFSYGGSKPSTNNVNQSTSDKATIINDTLPDNRIRAIKLMSKLDPLIADIDLAFREQPGYNNMERSFDDFRQQYILWLVQKELLVRDPEIMFDVLKYADNKPKKT